MDNLDEIENQTEEINKKFTTVDLKTMFTKYAYTIESVRKNKLVPDISINKFPKDFTSIKSTNDKKSLFIKSLLPLIILLPSGLKHTEFIDAECATNN